MNLPYLTIQQVFLPYVDAQASLAFYRDILGFEVRSDELCFESARLITLGLPGAPTTSIVLYSTDAEPTLTDNERRTIQEMMAKGNYALVALGTDNVNAVFEQLEAKAEVVREPIDDEDGVRQCAFRDPAGTLINVNQLP